MPCADESRYFPAAWSHSQHTSELLLIFWSKMGVEPMADVVKWSKTSTEDHCDVVVPMLCRLIKGLSEEELDKVVYNGRDKDCRKLAEWWDNHKEWDKKNGR